MLNYAYKARDEGGKIIKGVMEADDEADLFNRCRKAGLFVTSAAVTRTAVKKNSSHGKEASLKQNELLMFTNQTAISLDAGVPLLTILKDLAGTSNNKKMAGVVSDISRKVESGSTFREALSTHPGSFPPLFISIVGAGESTGKLAFVLQDLAKMIEWQMELTSKIKEASIYPIIMFVAMIGVVSVLMSSVVPKFIPMFKELNLELPAATQVVLGASKFWWLPFALGGTAGVVWFVYGLNESGKRVQDRIKLKIPIFGELIGKIALSRFCHTFALSLKSGVNVFNALGIAAEVTGNRFLESSVSKAKEYVNVGEKIAVAMDKAGKEAGEPFPDIVIRMINVGEQSGSLAETLEKVNQYYDKEIPSTVRKIFALMEPVMILFMGVVVGGIALSVFLPLTSLISGVGGN